MLRHIAQVNYRRLFMGAELRAPAGLGRYRQAFISSLEVTAELTTHTYKSNERSGRLGLSDMHYVIFFSEFEHLFR